MRHAKRALQHLATAAALGVLLQPVAARTLQVGAGMEFATPAAAAAAAQDGDQVAIGPGRYPGCAVWRASRLAIAGAGAEATVVGGRSCGGKAVFVIDGDDVAVRDLTLAGAHVPGRNGAGIRAEGGSLTVQRVHFADDENGILAADRPTAAITVQDSVFLRDGVCALACAHAIYAGHVALLRVAGSSFRDTREGHAIKSRAAVTEVVGNTIEDGPDGSASYLIEAPNGGRVTITGNRLQKGPHANNRNAAIMLGAEGGLWPPAPIVISGNSFRDDAGTAFFVINRTPTPARLDGNHIQGSAAALLGPGTVR